MRYLLIIFSLIFISCGTYKTQYYIHKTSEYNINTIDSINKVHCIDIPLNLNDMQNTLFKSQQGYYSIYKHVELRKDTLFVFSITVPHDTSQYIIKLRKEVNR